MDEVLKDAIKIKLLHMQKFEQLYQISNDTKFAGNQEEIDLYAQYIEDRQSIINDIDSINDKYNEISNSLDKSSPEYNDIIAIEEKIKIIINKVKGIDDKNNLIFSKLKDSLSKEMTQSVKRMKVSTSYLAMGENLGSLFFDRKN